MKLQQLELKDISHMEFDAIIAASGFEQRASYQATLLHTRSTRKIVLAFDKEMENKNRKLNDKIFRERGFKIFRKDGQKVDYEFFNSLIEEIIKNSISPNEVNIYVDYSSMTRNWYAQILLIIKNIRADKNICVYFGYSFSEYERAESNESLNKFVEPLFGFCNLSIPVKPTALIICLGNEINRAYGLKEYFDAETYLFYSDPKYGNKYSMEVEDVNYEIIKNIKPENVFKFPIQDLMYTDYLLENLCRTLLERYRVIIAPCGPKPFTLISLINSLKFESDIEVWRISPGEGLQKNERKENKEVSLLKVSFQN